MKIALVSPYDFAYPGGVVNHITALERHISQRGHDVRIIAPASEGYSGGEKFIQIGKPRAMPTTGSIVRVTISLHLAPQIKEVLDREKFDVIHLHEPFMPMLCSAVLRFSKAANIGTFHASGGSPGYNFGWPISRWMLKRRERHLDLKIAVSEAAKRYAAKSVSGPFKIIPNGIELDKFGGEIAPLDEYIDGKSNILFVGRLEGRKGLNYLISAFNEVKKEHPDSRLLVVGPGSRMQKRYEWLAWRKQIPDIKFVGFVSQSELPRYYQTAEIFCAPATGRESFGIVLLEAMALGKPIVATSIEGYAAVVTPGVEGVLVRPKDSKSLARALIMVLNDKKMKDEMGRNGKLKVKQYSWDIIADKVLSAYDDVLHGKCPAEDYHSPVAVTKNDYGKIFPS